MFNIKNIVFNFVYFIPEIKLKQARGKIDVIQRVLIEAKNRTKFKILGKGGGALSGYQGRLSSKRYRVGSPRS